MNTGRTIPWRRLDPLLLEAALLPIAERKAALQGIADREKINEDMLTRRLAYIGYRQPSFKMGPAGAAAWLKEMRETVRLYHNNIRLRSLIFGRYGDLLEQIREFATREYSDREAAKYLCVHPQQISFWADTLGALHRSAHTGKISGAELQRFFQEDRHILVNARVAQYRSSLPVAEAAGPGGSGPQEDIHE